MRNLSINDIQLEMMESGSHWWDLDHVNFFGIKVCSPVIHGTSGTYFVIAEWDRPWGEESRRRVYTIKQYNHETKDLENVGQEGDYSKRKEALDVAIMLAGENPVFNRQRHRPMTTLEQFVWECRRHGNPNATNLDAIQMIRWATHYNNLMEQKMIGFRVPSEHVEYCYKMICAYGKALGAEEVLAGLYEKGGSVRLLFPDQASNDTRHGGWRVPIESPRDRP